MDRRSFLKAAGAGAGAAALRAAGVRASLTGPTGRTPVQHLVVLMMENRSVDHFLGWYGAENPAFDARQQAVFPDLRRPDGPLVPTVDWGADGLANFHGRHHADPSHGWTGGRHERNGGAVDGWLHPGTGNDEYALSYYDADDLPVWAQLTRGWQAYDRWFCSVLGPTQP
ncbi:MAG: alkaline phosphatase family protein, partial [Acidimicrobiales bacterium]